MAEEFKIIGHRNATVSGDRTFVIAGSGLDDVIGNSNYGVSVCVSNDLTAYVGAKGGSVWHDNIYTGDGECPMRFRAQGQPWSMYVDDGNKGTLSTLCFVYETYHLEVNPGRFSYTLPTRADPDTDLTFESKDALNAYMGSLGYINIGPLTNFHWESETSGVGYVYVAGTILWESTITDPILITGQQVAVPGLRELLDYYPWAILKSNKASWESCNRSGGSLKIRKSGTWRDCKNRQSSNASDSTVFHRVSGSWTRCDKIGNNA